MLLRLSASSLTVCLILTVHVHGAETAPDQAATEFFEKKIRPVLVDHCYQCHSQTALAKNKLRGGLQLDHREAMLKGGDSGAAIEPGNPDGSLLLESLNYESFEMPPSGQLPANIIHDFRQWIEMGAPDPRVGNNAAVAADEIDIEEGRKHWCYRPLTMPAIPKPRANAESPIDAFILARLEAEQLSQSPLAGRSVLVRRLYFDLLGVPPTPEQIDDFVDDREADAVERLVDRLMALPQFGERWGRHWLDVVRYAESNTLRGFVFHEAWRYRDYVIDAFNSDRPYDQFLTEQIAGDLLPAETLEERKRNAIATTFLTLGNNNYEDQDKSKLRMDVVDEQLDTIGRGFLAQTIGCARCHDHKFDPIPTKDYYALAGILRNTKTLVHANVSAWIEKPLPQPAEIESAYKLQAERVSTLESEVDALQASLKDGAAGKSLPLANVPGVVVDDEQAVLSGSWKRSTSVPGFLGSGYQHSLNDNMEEKTAAFHPELPHAGEYEVRYAYTAGKNRSTHVPVRVRSADGERTIVINQQKSPPILGHFVSLGRYRFDQKFTAEVFVSNKGVSDVLIIDGVQFLPVDQGSNSPQDVLDSDSSLSASERASLEQKLKQSEVELATLKKQMVRPMYMTIAEHAEIADVQIHVRGDVHNLGLPAPRGFLQVAQYDVLPPIPDGQSGRRELGEWIADGRNPLTARVLANRIWHWVFGVGIVRTTDNFGARGEVPSHPELLDYLASRLVAQKWSVKRLLREIVLSRTYRTSWQPMDASFAADPENRLLWRMNRRRLDAECLLDAMLVVNGELRTETGGSTIRPGTQNDYSYEQDGKRRAVYWPVLRNSLPDLFRVFDFANPSVGTGRRNVSSTPPQALFLMNNPWVMEQAELAAKRLLLDDSRSNADRIQHAVFATLGRAPSDKELNSLLKFVESDGEEQAAIELKWTQLIQTLFASMDFRYIY